MGGRKPKDTHTPGPTLTLEFCIKKHLLGRILWSSKWLCLREKAQLHCIIAQKSAFVMWRTIENRQHHSVGGWWAVKGGRKQRSRWASRGGRTEVSVARTGAQFEEPSWLGGERRLGPTTKTTRYAGPPSSADHGFHIRLPFQVVLDLICTS